MSTVAEFEGFSPPYHEARIRDAGGQLYNVMAYPFGAEGDGMTDDTSAILKAIGAAKQSPAATFGVSIVYFPYTQFGYACNSLVLQAGVTLMGEGGVLLKCNKAATYFILASVAACGVTGFTIDAAGLPTSAVVDIFGTHIHVWRNKFISSEYMNPGVHAVQIMNGSSRTIVEWNDFESLLDNIRVFSSADRVTVRYNTFTDWGNRAVYVVGLSTFASTDLSIHDNFIGLVNTATSSDDPTWLGTVANPRQPIAIQGASGAFHLRPRIVDNTIVGNGLPNHQGNDGGTLLGGTADMISLHFCAHYVVNGNICVLGGEAGITIAEQSKIGTVSGNTVWKCNTSAVALGGSGVDTYDVAITGNTFADNGQELSPPAGGDRAGVHAAILASSAHGVTIDGNHIADDQGTHTQRYVVYGLNCDNIAVGINGQRNLTSTLDPASSGITSSTMPAASQPLA